MNDEIIIPPPAQIRERIEARRDEIRHLRKMLKLATSAVQAGEADSRASAGTLIQSTNGPERAQTEVAHA